jgi:ABC-2 type transport system ATP-binding protein
MTDEEIRHRGLELFNRFAMPQTAHRRLGEYSKGMRQKVGIIRAMLHSPAVLLLDEPTSAMDPHSAKLVRDAINELRADNRAIVVCTHNLLEAELLADKIAIIDKGRMVAEDNPASLKRKMHVLHKYEVHVDQKLNGQIKEIEDLVDVDSIDGDVIHFSTEDPFKYNPRLVRRLTGLGIGIVSIRELSVSLEDVYLTIVSGESDGNE